jgi:hypothetical protein
MKKLCRFLVLAVAVSGPYVQAGWSPKIPTPQIPKPPTIRPIKPPVIRPIKPPVIRPITVPLSAEIAFSPVFEAQKIKGKTSSYTVRYGGSASAKVNGKKVYKTSFDRRDTIDLAKGTYTAEERRGNFHYSVTFCLEDNKIIARYKLSAYKVSKSGTYEF